MSTEFQTKVAHFVEVSAAMLTDAEQRNAAFEQDRQAYQAKVASTVDELIATGFLKSANREVAMQKLADPKYALSQIVRLATGSSQEEQAGSAIGTPVAAPETAPKTAGVKGRRKGAHHDEFVRRLGLDPNA